MQQLQYMLQVVSPVENLEMALITQLIWMSLLLLAAGFRVQGSTHKHLYAIKKENL